jgi:hypothetical protein
MPNMLLHVDNDLPSIGLVPAAVELFRDGPELNDEAAREVPRLGLTALFAPKPEDAPSLSPTIIRASEPPMNARRFSRNAAVTLRCRIASSLS